MKEKKKNFPYYGSKNIVGQDGIDWDGVGIENLAIFVNAIVISISCCHTYYTYKHHISQRVGPMGSTYY